MEGRVVARVRRPADAAMGARTGEEYLNGLRARHRELWLGAERVDDVADHLRCAGGPDASRPSTTASTSMPDDCLMPDPETGEPINVSHMLPRSKEDLQRRHRRAGAHRRAVGRADGADAGLHERHLRRLRRRASGLARTGGPATRRASRTWPPSNTSSPARTSASRTRSSIPPSTGRATGLRRQPGAVAQGGHDQLEAASSSAVPASWRRWHRSPTSWPSTRATRSRPTGPPSTP